MEGAKQSEGLNERKERIQSSTKRFFKLAVVIAGDSITFEHYQRSLMRFDAVDGLYYYQSTNKSQSDCLQRRKLKGTTILLVWMCFSRHHSLMQWWTFLGGPTPPQQDRDTSVSLWVGRQFWPCSNTCSDITKSSKEVLQRTPHLTK